MMMKEGRFKEGANICLEEIEKMVINIDSRGYIGEIMEYLGRLVVFIDKIESDSGSKDDYSLVTYNIIKSNQLFGSVFDE